MVNNNFTLGFDAKRAFNNFTGLGNYSRSVLRGLWRLYPQVQTQLFTPKISYPAFYQECLRHERALVHLPKKKWKSLGPIWKMNGLSEIFLAQKREIEIFHGLSHVLPVNCNKISQLKKTRWVVTIHDLIFMAHPEFFPWIDGKIYSWEFLRSARSSDVIVAVSEHTKKDIVRYFGVSPDKIHVIYQGVDEGLISYAKDPTLLEKFEISDIPKEYFLYVGTLNSRKNALNLVKAYKILQEREKDLPSLLLVGGETPYKNIVAKYVRENNLIKNVIFLGEKRNEEIYALYSKAIALVLPSFYEGLGLPIVEAQFFGVPIITSPCSGLIEAAGPHSLYADPNEPEDLANKLKKIMLDSALAASFKDNGPEYVKKFQSEQCIQKLFQLYQNLL